MLRMVQVCYETTGMRIQMIPVVSEFTVRSFMMTHVCSVMLTYQFPCIHMAKDTIYWDILSAAIANLVLYKSN